MYRATGFGFLLSEEVACGDPQRVYQGRILEDRAQGGNTGVGGLEHRAAEAAGLRDMNGLDRRGRERWPYGEPLQDQPAGVREDDRAEGLAGRLVAKERDAFSCL